MNERDLLAAAVAVLDEYTVAEGDDGRLYFTDGTLPGDEPPERVPS